MSGAEAQARASLEFEVKAVDQTGQLRGIDFDVSYADKCGLPQHSCMNSPCMQLHDAGIACKLLHAA